MTPRLQPRLLNSNAAAEYLGMRSAQFRVLRPSWDIKPVVLGSRMLWDVRDLDRMIDKRKAEAPARA